MKKRLLALSLYISAIALAAPESVSAVVVSVDPQKARITLDHQRIKSIGMAAMVMPFKVVDGVSLASVKPGDKVRFTAAMREDHLVITSLERTP